VSHPRRPRFDTRPVSARYVVYRLAWGFVYIRALLFSVVIIIPPMLRTHISFIYHRGYIVLAIDSFVKENMSLILHHIHIHVGRSVGEPDVIRILGGPDSFGPPLPQYSHLNYYYYYYYYHHHHHHHIISSSSSSLYVRYSISGLVSFNLALNNDVCTLYHRVFPRQCRVTFIPDHAPPPHVVWITVELLYINK
jgi:hypothetical protein